MTTETGALEGLRILDFSRVLAGPYATMLLADLGADVLKVERPGEGDETRTWGPPWFEGRSTYFLGVNRNKGSIGLDLSVPDDRQKVREMVRTRDVVVENFRPGVMDRFGLGYAELRAENPAVIYCSITGFGTAGGAHLPGYDLIAQATSGFMSVTGGHAGPTKAGVAVLDIVCGLHALAGILAAVHHRAQTGEGQRIDVNLLSSGLSALANQASAYALTGTVPSAMGNAHPSVAPYEPFGTADRPLTIAAANDRQFVALLGVLGLDHLKDDLRFATNADRVQHREELLEQLTAVLVTRVADDWFQLLTDAGVPCGPINDLAQAFDLAESLGLEPVVSVPDVDGGALRQIRNPITLSRTPARYRHGPPALPNSDH